MVSVYSLRRKEPRIKLTTQVTVTISDGDGLSESCDTTTIDVSPHGASVRLGAPLALDTVVRFAAKGYPFITRAVVRSIAHDRSSGEYCVGLEYLDGANPIVVWQKRSDRSVVCEPSV